MSDLVVKVLPVVFVILALVLVITIFTSWYKRVPQDKAGVITGFGRKKVVTGGGGFVFPVINRIDYIGLTSTSLEVRTDDSMSSQKVPINVVSTVVLKVKNDDESIYKAIEQFNGRNVEEVKHSMEEIAVQILEGKLREVVSTLSVEELYSDREKFSNSVQDAATQEFATMGIEIVSFTIKDVTDSNGYIESLGVKQIVEKKKEAEIAKAEADRDRQIKTSEAKRDGERAKLEAETEIAKANKEKLLKEQLYAKETQASKAITDQAYEIQQNITRKDVIQSQMDATLLETERQKDIEIAREQINIAREMKRRELAEKEAETAKASLKATIVEPAIADREKQQQIADASKYQKIAQSQADAESAKLQAEAAATAAKMKAEAEAVAIKMKAEADAESVKLNKIAEAEGIKATKFAEAEGTRATKLAEAEGIKAALLAEAEGMEKKAEAYKKYGEAAILEMIVNVLPEMAGKIAEPLSKIESIKIIGSSDGESGVSNISNNVGMVLAKTMETVKETTGIDFKEIIDADIRGKTDKNVTFDGIEPPKVIVDNRKQQ